ncbi:MAG: hypothetical protein ACRDAX_02240 [Propionibacteriaceae bacterium]
MNKNNTIGSVSSAGENASDREQGYSVFAYMVTGPLLYGGMGFLGDSYFHTNYIFIFGFSVGIVLALYIIIKKFGGMDSGAVVNSGDIVASPREESL